MLSLGVFCSPLLQHFDNILDVDVILEWQKFHRTVELKMSVFGTLLTATEEADEMHKAINGAVDKAERQIVKYKDKLRGFEKKAAVPQPAEVYEEDIEDYLED